MTTSNLRTAAQQALEALLARAKRGDGAPEVVAALRAALEQPTVPPEAQTEAEKIAYCAGWWAAMEAKAKEQPEQEPVAFVPVYPRNGPLWSMTTNEPSQERLPSYPLTPLYTHPPRREWRSLTEEEIVKFADEVSGEEHSVEDFARAIEAALKEKNK
jgi:hypothetical protein